MGKDKKEKKEKNPEKKEKSKGFLSFGRNKKDKKIDIGEPDGFRF